MTSDHVYAMNQNCRCETEVDKSAGGISACESCLFCMILEVFLICSCKLVRHLNSRLIIC